MPTTPEDEVRLEKIARRAVDFVEAFLDGRAAIVVSREPSQPFTPPGEMQVGEVIELAKPITVIRLRMDP